MFVNGIAHHNQVREELIKVYKIMTQKHFSVITSRSAFLTTEQLEVIENNPPIGGLELFSTPYHTKVTIEKIINAYLLGGEGYQMTFRHPRKEIPIIYETLQDAVRLWTDIKLNSYDFETAPLEELEAIEYVAKSLFSIYRYYYKEKLQKELALEEKFLDDNYSVANIYLNILQHGMEEPEEISFISYLDLYREKQRADNSFTGNYAKQNLSIEDIPAAQPRRFDTPNHKTGTGNWLDND